MEAKVFFRVCLARVNEKALFCKQSRVKLALRGFCLHPGAENGKRAFLAGLHDPESCL